ncbi:hypothetical protein BD410DRAFT_297412 [Rickenella mellea]|uniref:Uncharacterized protein n=1 Tax=Rickenella mellea TaxID=50990 RepID=A0A4Y7Q2T1_9AGAM|nr:hypothetical protein BD410DRAFT_297412 [Rickenella mellea]
MSPSRSPHENGDLTSSVGAGPRAFESQDEDIQPPFSPFVDTQHHTHLPLFDQSSNNTSMDILSVACLNPAPIGPPPAPSAAVSSVSAVPAPVTHPLSGAPSAFMADFPPQPIPSSADDMQGIDVVPSPPTSSSNPSLVASPVPIHDQTPPFASHTSSLATALDDPSAAAANIANGGGSLDARSRSGSLASPSASMLSSRSAEIGYVSRGTPSSSSQTSSYSFPSNDYDFHGLISSRNLHANDLSSRPDPVTAPHMLAADDVLEKIIRAASSAREACSLGEPAQANAKVDEMKRSIMLVSHLLAATTIDTGSAPASDVGSPPRTLPQAHAHASPPGGLHTQSPNLVSSFPDANNISTPNGSAGPILAQPTASIPTAMDTMGSLDPGDMTRKRCASSMAADSRVQKALKLEPSEDDDVMPLSQLMPPMSMLLPSSADNNSTASSVSAAVAGGVMGGAGSAVQPIVVQSIPVLPPLVSTPPSAPPSRPGSRGGSDWAVLSSSSAAQQSPIPIPVPSSSNGFNLSLNLANAAAATRAGVNIPSPFPSPIKTRPGGAWPDLQASTTLPPLTHSLSHPLSHTHSHSHSHLPHPLQQSDIPPQPSSSSSVGPLSIPGIAELVQPPMQPLSFGSVGLPPLPVPNYARMHTTSRTISHSTTTSARVRGPPPPFPPSPTTTPTPTTIRRDRRPSRPTMIPNTVGTVVAEAETAHSGVVRAAGIEREGMGAG